MQIIIVRCGKVGTTIAEQLSSENHDVTVVDVKAYKVEFTANTFDAMGVVGNGINPEYAAATEIARLLRFPSAKEVDTFPKGRIELIRLKVKPEYRINGVKIYDIRNKFK